MLRGQKFGNGNNRVLIVRGKERHYFLHGTRILFVVERPRNLYLCEVDTGGHITATTVKALNEALENAGFTRIRAGRSKGVLTVRNTQDQAALLILDECKPAGSFWASDNDR